MVAPAAKPKRFYTSVDIAPLEDGWTVMLDARPLNTPAKAGFRLPARTLAEAVAEEWSRQEDRIDIQRMHLTRPANVALDRTPSTREGLAEEVAKYCETDLLCHLAEGPATLRAHQEAAWRPIRDWAGRALGVVLLPVEGIVAMRQPPASLEAARRYALGLDDFGLTGLTYGCGLFSSALLSMALREGEIAAAAAFEAARIDEAFQESQWGVDEEARRVSEDRKAETKALNLWFRALNSETSIED